jgi:hypothetical protein
MIEKASKWEIAGISMAGLFEVLHHLGTFTTLGISDEQLPHVMVLLYAVSVFARAAYDARQKKDG